MAKNKINAVLGLPQILKKHYLYKHVIKSQSIHGSFYNQVLNIEFNILV